MPDAADYLGWPFFDDSHRALASTVDGVAANLAATAGGSDTDAACRAIVRGLGEAGLLRLCIDSDVRSLCLARERLAQTDAVLDFAFAMQGLGSAPITLFGSDEQKGACFRPSSTDAHHGVRPLRARRRQRCRRTRHDGGASRRRLVRVERCQDVDLERRHRRS